MECTAVEDREEDMREARGHCPTCRAHFHASELKPAAVLIKNMVDSLLVKCPHESRGCTHVCERGLVDSHARRECGWTYVGEYEETNEKARSEGEKCLHGRCECGKRVLRKDWQHHTTSGECTVSRVACPYAEGQRGCGALIKEGDLEEHLEVCPARPVDCAHCGRTLTQGELDSHLAMCEDVVVACPLERFGCAWQGRRADLGEEGGSAQAATLHLGACKVAPLRSFLESNATQLSSLSTENGRLAARVRALEQEQAKMTNLLQICMQALGDSFVRADADADSSTNLADRAPRQSDVVVPISSPPHRNGGSISPPLALRGRSGSSTAVARQTSTSIGPDAEAQVSTSAPATSVPNTTDSDFPWQWPEPEEVSRASLSQLTDGASRHTGSQPPSLTISESLRQVHRTMASMAEQMAKVERRMEDAHVVSLNAGFEAGRAHEELNSVRHGMHSIRLQMHSLLMQQQMERNMPNLYPGQTLSPAPIGPSMRSPIDQTGSNAPSGPPSAQPPPPQSMIGLRRFWTGFEQTKL